MQIVYEGRRKQTGKAFFCPQLVVLYESLNRRLVMDNFDMEVLDPREVDLGIEWDSEEPELDMDDVPGFDRGRVKDTMDVSELFDDPEKF